MSGMGHGLEGPRKLMRIGNGTSLLCSHRTGLCLPDGARTHPTSSCRIVLNHRLRRPNPQGWAATSLTAGSENPGFVDGKSFQFPFHTCSLKSDVIDSEGILSVGLEFLIIQHTWLFMPEHHSVSLESDLLFTTCHGSSPT